MEPSELHVGQPKIVLDTNVVISALLFQDGNLHVVSHACHRLHKLGPEAGTVEIRIGALQVRPPRAVRRGELLAGNYVNLHHFHLAA